ncbi:MAG: S8 family serine peptidase [Planctomycetota bacterium]
MPRSVPTLTGLSSTFALAVWAGLAAAQPLGIAVPVQSTVQSTPQPNLQPAIQPAAQPQAARALPVDAEVLVLPTHAGPRAFRIADATQAVTQADRLPDEHIRALDPDGSVIPAEAGWRAHATVLVRADQRARAEALAGVRAAPVAGDWHALRLGSVRDAARAASRLTNAGVEARVEVERPWTLRGTIPTDDRLSDQWHLINTVPGAEQIDLEADAAWMLGATGAGVTVGVVEIGFRQQHPELAPNYRPEAAQVFDNPTSHGTSVAGLIAAQDDGDGVVGLAHDAQLSQQLIGSPTTTAEAFAFRNDLNDIKNHSYGPSDSSVIHVWDPIEAAGVRDAMINGRGGLGTVFVWAAGNRSNPLDRVDYDPYAASRYTIAISGHTDADTIPFYAEPGSSVFAVAPSSGSNGIHRDQVTSGFVSNIGTPVDVIEENFGFTSGAAPLGSAVVALMLQMRPDLTWIDVQHALVNDGLRDIAPSDAGWQTNAAGRRHHEHFGFGALNALKAVESAQAHRNVGTQVAIETELLEVEEVLPDVGADNPVSRTFTVTDDIEIDHVELVLTLDASWQGDVAIKLTGPDGTVSTFAETRPADFQNNIQGRVFTSLRHWGERSAGEWTVTLEDGAAGFENRWVYAQLRFYGGCRPADVSGAVPGSPPDGQVTLTDFSIYLNRWAAGDPAADITNPALGLGNCAPGFGVNRPAGDGVQIDDFMCYLNAWFNGCPQSAVIADSEN